MISGDDATSGYDTISGSAPSGMTDSRPRIRHNGSGTMTCPSRKDAAPRAAVFKISPADLRRVDDVDDSSPLSPEPPSNTFDVVANGGGMNGDVPATQKGKKVSLWKTSPRHKLMMACLMLQQLTETICISQLLTFYDREVVRAR